MPIRNRWIFLFLFCHAVLLLSKAKGQQQYDIVYYFERDTIQITSAQTFSNKLNISNHTDRSIELRPLSANTAALRGLIKLPASIILKAKETKFFPLKYIADRQTIAQGIQAFTIGLESDDPSVKIQPPQSFYTQLEMEQSFLIQTEQSEYYLDQATGQTQFSVRAVNRGLVPLTVQLRFPNLSPDLEIIGETLPFTLVAGGQSLLTFTARLRKKNINMDFDVDIQAVEGGGSVLASNRIRMMTVGSVKRFFSNMNLQNQPRDNRAALRYINMGQDISVYQLQGDGKIDLNNKDRLSYRMNLDYYQDQRTFNLYDTYLDYDTEKWGVKLGNIYENLDQFINGRGIKGTYKFDKRRSLSLYAIQNNYMLFTEMDNPIPGGEIVGVKYAIQTEQNQENSMAFLHSNNDYRGVRSGLFSGKGFIDLGNNNSLFLEGGTSIEQVESGNNRLAVAGGINYNTSFGNYQLTSVNYYSSPYYVGLRRGLTQTDSRITLSLANDRNLSARISYMDNNPKYLAGDRNYFFSNASRIQIYELGYHTGFGKLQLDLRPYFMAQQGTYQNWWGIATNPTNWKSNSLRTVADLNFFTPGHRFSLQTDYGYTYRNTSNRPIAPFHSVRINGNYTHTFFGFNTFIQINPYYLSDLLATSANSNYSIYSLGPNTQFYAFNNQLHVQLSTIYSYYGFSRSNNLSVNGNVRWQIKENWNLTADIFYTAISGKSLFLVDPNLPPDPNPLNRYSFNNRQIRLGIEKNFGRRAGQKGHKLELTFFEDDNNNGSNDVGETKAGAVLVRVGKEVAQTDGNGRVKFVDMGVGPYLVQVENSKGWVSRGPINVLMTKNQRLEIPLIKTRPLKGRIKVVDNKYLKTRPQLGGIKITAADSQGKIYSTLSSENGDYVLYLPLGNYSIAVVTEGMPFSIENQHCEIEVKADTDNIIPDFNYRDERRKVGVKRF
ncbi:TonB-dependent receptor [Sphingobacterium sp. HMA12]|uniref:TonB-dependent receptor n=1 Tax=Sphingobacterium sp. HMA12 TaxID=2050894 RepID=UPI000CEA37F9|nr:TonB-dependent receptor [Sphingobacterium sp. HMA12]